MRFMIDLRRYMFFSADSEEEAEDKLNEVASTCDDDTFATLSALDDDAFEDKHRVVH